MTAFACFVCGGPAHRQPLKELFPCKGWRPCESPGCAARASKVAMACAPFADRTKGRMILSKPAGYAFCEPHAEGFTVRDFLATLPCRVEDIPLREGRLDPAGVELAFHEIAWYAPGGKFHGRA